MKNLPEFKKLIERYESVTIEEIEKNWLTYSYLTAKSITGYGDATSCTLCRAVSNKCTICTWESLTNSECVEYCNAVTYDNISEAKTPNDLLTAFRTRAAYMRQVLKDGGIE